MEGPAAKACAPTGRGLRPGRGDRPQLESRWRCFLEHACLCGLLPLRHLLLFSGSSASMRRLAGAAWQLLPAVELQAAGAAPSRLDCSTAVRVLQRVGGERTQRVCLAACGKLSVREVLTVVRVLGPRYPLLETLDISACGWLARLGVMWLAIEEEVGHLREQGAEPGPAVSWEAALAMARNGGRRGHRGSIPRLLLGDVDARLPTRADLHRSAQDGTMPLLEFLLSVEVPAGDGSWQTLDVNGKARNGDRALHAACRRAGNVPVVRRLLEAGADVNALGHNKETPLHCACSRRMGGGDASMVCLLLEHGAIVDAKDRDGDTSLNRALRLTEERARRAVVGELLACGACAHIANARREQPLHVACQLGDAELVKTLIRHGANIETPSVYAPIGLAMRHGSRPVHVASRLGDGKILQILLEEGAQVDAADELGWTALNLARAKECRDLLVAAGARMSYDGKGE
jgi:ankyrin repeat protein